MVREDTQAALEAVQGFFAREIKARIGVFLDRAEHALLSQLPNAGYTSLPAASRTAARWLADNRGALQAAMHQRMVQSFAGHTAKKNIQYDELQLLGDEALNVVMVRARMVSRVMEQARDPVVVLEARLEALRQAGAQINPKSLTPGAIADGFIAVLNDLAVPQQVQAPLMEVYGERGVEMLIEFYEGINQLLIRHGVLPDFKYCIVKSPDSNSKSGQAQYAPTSDPIAPAPYAPPQIPAQTQSAPDVVWDPIPSASSTEFAPVPAGHVTIPAQFALILDAKLTIMQQALTNLSMNNWQPGTLRETFKLPPPFALSADQEESIDHIEAVFLDLLRDPRISTRFRTEMSRLILPLMTLRLTDAEQLSTPDNAARRFVRQLALLGYRDQESPVQDFEHIQLVVGRIVSERAQELASFVSGADALYTIAKNEVQRQLAARRLTRTQSVEEEPARNDEQLAATDAHKYVLTGLRLLSAGLRLPPAVEAFVLRLLGPWMMVRYQRYGEDSQPMRDSCNFALMFFNLLRPAVSDADRENKIVLRTYALEQIEIRATRSRVPADEKKALIDAIEKFFEELNADPSAGIAHEYGGDTGEYASYLDNLPVTVAA